MDVALQNIDYIKLLMFMFKLTSTTDVIFYLIAMRVAFSRSYIDVEKIGSVMQPSIVETLEESI